MVDKLINQKTGKNKKMEKKLKQILKKYSKSIWKVIKEPIDYQYAEIYYADNCKLFALVWYDRLSKPSVIYY